MTQVSKILITDIVSLYFFLFREMDKHFHIAFTRLESRYGNKTDYSYKAYKIDGTHFILHLYAGGSISDKHIRIENILSSSVPVVVS